MKYSSGRHTCLKKIVPPSPSARYYNSDLSIWISVDPLSDKYPNLSPYTYCANNPVRLVDPDGRDWYVPEGASYAVYDKNVTKENIPKGSTYIGKTAHWFGQTESDRQYCYHGDAKGNITMQDMTVTITANTKNTDNSITKDVILGFGNNVGKHADNMSITSRGVIHYRTNKNRLYMGNQYESAKVVGKTAFGKACKKMPYITAAISLYEMGNTINIYGVNSRETASTAGGILGSFVMGAAVGAVVGGGIPGAIVGGILGGILGDIGGRKVGGALYDEFK